MKRDLVTETKERCGCGDLYDGICLGKGNVPCKDVKDCPDKKYNKTVVCCCCKKSLSKKDALESGGCGETITDWMCEDCAYRT